MYKPHLPPPPLPVMSTKIISKSEMDSFPDYPLAKILPKILLPGGTSTLEKASGALPGSLLFRGGCPPPNSPQNSPPQRDPVEFFGFFSYDFTLFTGS